MGNNVYTIIITVIIAINSIFIITAIFFERKKPTRALSWILALSLVPVLGFIFYLIFGRSFHFKKKKIHLKCKRHIQSYRDIYKNLVFAQYDESGFKENYNDDIKQLIKLNLNSSKSPFTNDNNVKIFTQSKEKYSELLSDIERANVSIHMVYYILKNDGIGSKIINALAAKAKQGVSVKVLFDHGNRLFFPYREFKPILDNGGEVLCFLSNSLSNYLKINFRNHHKIVVIDGKIGYMGGVNIGDEYLGLHKRITPWRDTHMRITGSSVYSLQLCFMTDWLYASKGDVQFGNMEKYFMPADELQKGKTGIQIVSSGPDTHDEEIKRGLIKMINSAKKRILVQTPYFIPDDSFLEALQNASMSGVEVILQVPGLYDRRMVYKVTMSFIEDVIKYGIKIYHYPGFLHAKMLVVDDSFCSIGTANLDMRSFSLNFEVNAFMYGKEITDRCSEIFYMDLKKSKLIINEYFSKRSILSKVEEKIYRLLSPLL